MPSVVLGRTGLKVSALSVGTWGWGARTPVPPQVRVSDRSVLRSIVQTALDGGINFFQTASGYENEDILASLLSDCGASSDVIVATKFGHGLAFSADGVRRAAERSLELLGRERLPLFFLHDPRTPDDIEAIQARGGALEGLRRLQDEGLIGAIGVATGSLPALEAAVETDLFDAIQFPRLHTLLAHSERTLGLLRKTRRASIGTMSAAPFGGDILGVGSASGVYGFFPPLPEVREAVERMETVAEACGVTLAEVALAYNYRSSLIDVTVPGLTNAREVEIALSAFSSSVTDAQLQSIVKAGEIAEEFVGGPEFHSAWPAERAPSREDFESVFGVRASD